MKTIRDILDQLLSNGPVKIAIEGGSASGKTTLSKQLAALYDCSVLHMDDFFLQAHQRTPERYAEVGGNIDRERFLQEVLGPLRNGQTIRYRKFNCSTMQLEDETPITPKKLTIIEGVYSMHPAFEAYYDFSIFLDISSGLQKERIVSRNTPQLAKRYFTEWIPLENTYFEKTNAKQRCDFIMQISENH